MDTLPRTRPIDVLLFDGVNALDVSGPAQAFDVARFDGRRLYGLRYVSLDGGLVRSSCGLLLGAEGALATDGAGGDLLVPGGSGRAALQVARELVVQLRRTGGQSQYAMHLAGQIASEDAFSRLIETVISEPGRQWTLDDMAAEAGMNRRTLTRHFQARLATSPARFVERLRVDHARSLLEAELPLKRIAREAGFGDLQRMRRAFQRRYGVSIAEYVATFGDEATVR